MRRLITLFAIVALGLVIACGGGDDDDSSEDTSSAGSGDSTSSSSSDSSGGPSDAGSSSSGGSKDNFCTPEYADAIFEGFDPLTSLKNNARDRFVFGMSWFPLPMCEIRAEYRLNRDIPQRIEGNADEIVIELHGFL